LARIAQFSGLNTAFPKHGTAMFWEVGVIKLTANRRQFSPISLNRGRKQAKLPDPLWDEGHYRIGFRRPSQVGRIQTFVLSQENK
jgi:hypothetical protein